MTTWLTRPTFVHLSARAEAADRRVDRTPQGRRGRLGDREAKRASGGWPGDIVPTLSAFANTPGGGTILFGVDEASGFEISGVYDPAACQKALATTCRSALDPPISQQSWIERLEGGQIVVAEIPEADASAKPVRVKATGKSYLRSHDGDFPLSAIEEQAFIASRAAPHFDRMAVPGAVREDLDKELCASYIDACRSSSSSLARFGDEEILFRTGVTVGEERTPSMAGMLALGVHPQQYLPSLVIQAHVSPRPDDPPGTRATDPRRFDGPIPRMLSDALAWVRRNTGSRVVFAEDGHGRDEPEYPAEAVRELVANALVHRDLGAHAAGTSITLILEQGRLVLSNPGGLYGISRDRLGQQGVTSARNPVLVRICQNVRFRGDQRVCEALASGIPTVLAAVRRAQMTPPAFFDQGIRFTVSMPNHALLAREDLEWLSRLQERAAGLTDIQRHALVMMRRGAEFTNRMFRDEFPMDSRDARRELGGLVQRELAVADGERGGRTYRIAGQLIDPSPPDHARTVLSLLQAEPADVNRLTGATGLSKRQVRYALRKLREAGDVEILTGGRGQTTLYGVRRDGRLFN
jgi:ATP-dependent DNA helicase RecG